MDNDFPKPPNAPPTRRAVGDPLDVVERLVADQASQLSDDETWERYSQVADEVALTHAQWTLIARLDPQIGRVVQVAVPGQPIGARRTLVGTLKDIGDGWGLIVDHPRVVLVNLALADFWSWPRDGVAPEIGPPEVGDRSRRLASWSTALRRLQSANGEVRVVVRSGPPLDGRIVLAGKDHFDLAVTSLAENQQDRDHLTPAIVSIATSAVVTIEHR